MLLLIDNHDSFTYNLVQYFQELGATVSVYANDRISLNDIVQLKPQQIVFSPGPGRPENAGVTLACIKKFSGSIPMLGVCLGHQAMALAFGGQVTMAKKVMHGKASRIYHHQQGIFSGLANPFTATRYHSLIVDRATLPNQFAITAWTHDHEIMAFENRRLLLTGVQFHPESILTDHGHHLLKNFLDLSVIPSRQSLSLPCHGAASGF